MGKVVFKDHNSNVLASSVLPDGFEAEAVLNVVNQQYDQKISFNMEARKQGCQIVVRSGFSDFINKIQQPPVYYYMQPANDPNSGSKELSDIRSKLDEIAETILNRKAGKGDYFELSDKFKEKHYPELKEYINSIVDDIYIGTLASPIPIGAIFRNYLFDGGLGFYECDKQYLAICIYRVGVETDLSNYFQGISEDLSNKPFSKADIMPNAANSTASVRYPMFFYMLSERKEDLKTFMSFVDEFELSKQFIDYKQQLYKNTQQLMLNQAQMARSRDQTFIDATWQMNAAQLASMDRVRDSIAKDMDRFHADMDKMMKDSNSKSVSSIHDGESLDDRIQRGRHETMMDVETYDRSDGTTVEFDNRADRVFENNLDQNTHFGTEHYYSDYVPDGWHEMKKK